MGRRTRLKFRECERWLPVPPVLYAVWSCPWVNWWPRYVCAIWTETKKRARAPARRFACVWPCGCHGHLSLYDYIWGFESPVLAAAVQEKSRWATALIRTGNGRENSISRALNRIVLVSLGACSVSYPAGPNILRPELNHLVRNCRTKFQSFSFGGQCFGHALV